MRFDQTDPHWSSLFWVNIVCNIGFLKYKQMREQMREVASAGKGLRNLSLGATKPVSGFPTI